MRRSMTGLRLAVVCLMSLLLVGPGAVSAADSPSASLDRALQEQAPEILKQLREKGYKNVGVEEFDKLRADKKAVVLDVRTRKEFDAGHLPGAVNLDFNGPDFAKKAAELEKSKTYLVHCASGGRSAKASDLMSGKLQLPHVFNLEGGFKAWEKAGKPVEK